MAIYKVINQAGNYRTSRDVEKLIRYITLEDKTPKDGIIGGAVLPENAAEAMNAVTDAYHQERGPRVRHSVLSFSPDEILSERQVKEIAKKCVSYYEDRYQILAAIHEDKEHLHIHFAMNTTSYLDGKKYHGVKKDYFGFMKHIDHCLSPYGLCVIPQK